VIPGTEKRGRHMCGRTSSNEKRNSRLRRGGREEEREELRVEGGGSGKEAGLRVEMWVFRFALNVGILREEGGRRSSRVGGQRLVPVAVTVSSLSCDNRALDREGYFR